MNLLNPNLSFSVPYWGVLIFISLSQNQIYLLFVAGDDVGKNEEESMEKGSEKEGDETDNKESEQGETRTEEKSDLPGKFIAFYDFTTLS